MNSSVPQDALQEDDLPLLPATVPVPMPDLPVRLTLSTEHQFKAIGDMARSRILGVIQFQPLTAKQIAQRLHATTGAVGHHLRVLEEAGLVKVVARRYTRGIIASYYTRTARLFDYDPPQEVTGLATDLGIVSQAQAELMDAVVSYEDDPVRLDGFPHVRLSLERALEWRRRLGAVVEELIEAPPDPKGEVYGVFLGIFKSPPALQISEHPEPFSPRDEES